MRKYTPSGGIVWSKQLHYSEHDRAIGIAVSGSSVYVVGEFYNNAATSTDLNVRLIKLTTDGSVVWSTSYGSSHEQYVSGVSVVGSSLFVSGYEWDGSYTGFVLRYNANGTYVWRADQASSGDNITEAVLARSASEIYAAGRTSGALGGSNSGEYDAFLRRLNGNGSTVWTDQ